MTTKLELTQLLAARNTDLEAARVRISILEGELALRPRPSAPTLARLRYLAQRDAAPTGWVRPAWMEAARAQAMATGSVVKA